MSGFTMKSPITGKPDYTLQLPKKPVRLHLEPFEALALYVALEQMTTVMNKYNANPEMVGVLIGLTDKLHDRLEVTFHEHP